MQAGVKKFAIFVLSFFILFININIANNFAYDLVDKAFYLRTNVQLEISEFQHNNSFLSTLLDPDDLNYHYLRDVIIHNEELYLQLSDSVNEYNEFIDRYDKILSKEGFVSISEESIESLREFDHDEDGMKRMLYEGLKKEIAREKEGDL